MLNKRSIFLKMILFGSALCILPVIALGFFSYLRSSEAIQIQVKQGNAQFLTQLKGNIEQVLVTLDNNLSQVVNSTTFQEAFYRQLTVYDFQLLNSLKKNMSFTQSVDSKVTDVLLANTENNWLISNDGLYAFDKFPKKDELLSFIGLPLSSNWILNRSELSASRMTESYECEYIVTLVKKLPVFSMQKKGLAVAHIPSCSLSAMIDNPSQLQDVVVFKDQQILIHPNEKMIGKSVLETGYVSKEDLAMFNDPEGQFEIKRGTGRYSVSYIRSEYNGWIYASFTDINHITAQSRAIGWFTLYLCLLIIGISVCFVWFGSRKIYTPIRQIMRAVIERFPHHDKNRQDEFQMIHEHITQLIESNSSLRGEMQQYTKQLRTTFIHKLFQGKMKSSEIGEALVHFDYEKRVAAWERMAVLTLQIEMHEQIRYSTKDLDLLQFAVSNILEEMVPAHQCLGPVIHDQTQVALVGCSGMNDRQFKSYIFELAESIQHNIKSYLKLVVSIGISLPFSQLDEASRAYQEGLEALKYRLKLGEGIIISSVAMTSGKQPAVFSYPQHISGELIDSIKLADQDRVRELLKEWMEYVFSKERMPWEYQNMLMLFLNELMVVLQESGISMAELGLEGCSLYEELLQLYVGADIEAWFQSRILIPMIQVFTNRRDSLYHNLSAQIIDFIQTCYLEDITLEQCAARLHYNSSYLSTVFKQETGMTFSDYLAMHRQKAAKQWLIETNMTVKEIAKQLNYNNPQNFIRSFRKQEGMTPGTYREKFGKQVPEGESL
ncbi:MULTISPECIES: helix-turn-helix domain-containing protein [unclassified Paenibacillus]|uniref:helix-turn-helix domain-containing protein n=1 Tax=unclassified Paenibacillus TaxID=185978 RepID=UPI003642DEDA